MFLFFARYVTLDDTTEVMTTQKIKSAARLNQSIDWICVGMTRILHGDGMPQYTTSTPRCAIGVWVNPEITVITPADQHRCKETKQDCCSQVSFFSIIVAFH